MSVTIPKGYKQSSLGIIPINWESYPIDEVFEYINTPSFARENLTFEKTQNEVYYIHYGDIHSTFKSEILDFDNEKNIPFLKDFFCDGKLNYLRDGDLVIADASEDYAGVGECIELKNIKSKKVIGGLHTIVLRDKAKLTYPGFSTYIFKTVGIHNTLKKIATGISVYSISKGNLSKFKIILPPIAEQKKIANALSLMENTIGKINLLISKKELQKKALMQQLLSGKKRLKGFSDKWRLTDFKNSFQFIKSYALSRDGLTTNDVDGRIYCVHYGDIHAFYENEFLDFSAQKGIPKIIDENTQVKPSDYLIDGDIILADASEDYAGVGEAVEVINIDNKIAVGGLHTIVLRGINDTTLAGFRRYLFASETIRNTLRKKATGTSVYSITKSTLESLFFNLPSAKEQNAIAAILQAADKEIQLLKIKADKLKEQKKGMMQLLLTGKKRLKVNDDLI